MIEGPARQCGVLLVGAMLLLWLVAARIGDVSFIDAVWGRGMAVLAIPSWASGCDAPGARRR